jgi:altronate hydrolase
MTTADSPLLSRANRGDVAINDVTVRLNPLDDVIIAKVPLLPRTRLVGDGEDITIAQMIPPGHKVAVHAIAEGHPVRRYGQTIGFATRDIAPGQHVHTQNLEVHQGELDLDYGFSENVIPVEYVPEAERRTFMGYRRADGRVGTRNFVALLASVNCSSTAVRRVADHFRDHPILDQYPNVDGVIAFPTKGGCGAHYGSDYLGLLQTTMAGIVDHPNIGGYVIVSLGCETNQPDDLIEFGHLNTGHRPQVLTIKRWWIPENRRSGIAAVLELLPEANKVEREPVPASELVVALQCGGSTAGRVSPPTRRWGSQ